MKRIASLALLILIAGMSPTMAAETMPTGFGHDRFTMGVEGWYVQGDQVLTGGPVYANNRFELVHPIDQIMTTLYGELRFFERWSIRGAYGFGYWDEGTLTDTDWDENGRLWYLSNSKCDGDTNTFETDLYFRIFSRHGSHLDVAAGYRYLKNEAKYYDGFLVLDDYETINTQTTGTWNKLKTEMHAWRIGLRGELALHRNLALRGFVGFNPYIWGQYRATRYPGTAYQQKESVDPEGQGIEAFASLNWRPCKYFSMEIGYRYLKWDFDGDENYGSSFYGIHNEFEITMGGGFAAAMFHF